MEKPLIYRSLALQTTCYAINPLKNHSEAKAKMLHNLDIIRRQLRASKAFIGQDVRLVVLPEYFMTGFPMGESIEEWKLKACIAVNGKEYEVLAEIAQENQVYLCGNAYELDEHFPQLYFQTNFIMAPDGKLILRYRRLNSMFAPTPHDVWEKYLDTYGLEAVFPVAKTEIGNLATIASEEILYPEIARCMAMRGAEVFLHPTSEVGSPLRTPKDVCKFARAIENLAYVISANSAGISEIPVPLASTDGKSKVIDYRGLLLAEADTGESMAAYAEIDIQALRYYRHRTGMNNLLSRQRFELFAESYARHSFYPANQLLGETEIDKNIFIQTQKNVIEKLKEKQVI